VDYIHVTLQMALSSEQVRALLGAARGTRFEALYIVAVHTGLRQGELLGLRLTDVDVEAASPRLSVRRSLKITDGLNFGPPKNKASRRSVPLNHTTVAALQAHRTRQNEERLRLGDLWQDRDLIFPNRVGKPLDHNNLYYREYKPLLQ
jgi:integrase